MRISIREQLGLLWLFTNLTALAVLAIASWVQNYSFVINIRHSSLSLTASLKAAQLSATLSLFQTSVSAISTRLLIQTSLQNYKQDENNTERNWSNPILDVQSALSTVGQKSVLLQAIIFPANNRGPGSPHGLINVTGSGLTEPVPLPYKHANGSQVYLGDPGLGFPPLLYPNFTYPTSPNETTVFFGGEPLYTNSTLLLGPWQVNETFALLSVTVGIVNNALAGDILGWLTVVFDAKMIYNIYDSPEGLENTGQVLLVGPDTANNLFPSGFSTYNSLGNAKPPVSAGNQAMRFLLPPQNNASRAVRHTSRGYPNSSVPFPMRSFPAVYDAFEHDQQSINNAGSLFYTHNEQDIGVSIGFARPASLVCDWVLLVEQGHGEVVAPIRHLRNVLLACVFGTTGGLLLFVFPIAHFSVRPISRLREATKRTVEPHPLSSQAGSIRSVDSGVGHDFANGDEDNAPGEARKEGFLGLIPKWRPGRRVNDHAEAETFAIPGKVHDGKHYIHDELTDLTKTFNQMSEELVMQYERLEERVKIRTAELEQSKKAAEVANESKTLFIANISHELKTPLNGILGMCAVTMGEDDPSKIKRSLGIIYKSGDLLLHLLTDLLTFSKNQIGQQQIKLDEKEFRLADVSSQILSIFDKQAKDGQIDLKVVFQGSQGALGGTSEPSDQVYGPYGTGKVRNMWLWGDQHRILQVLINLVSNSLKFTPSGGSVEVRIKCMGEDIRKEFSRSSSNGSKQSRQQSARTSRTRRHDTQGSDSSLPVPGLGKSTSHILRAPDKSSDRSASPPLLNTKWLVFQFDVEDTGPGIPEDQQQRVFEPFVQGDLGLSKKYGGTGLGLSICSQLASLMGGTISLNSKESVGSTFSMRIPLRFVKVRTDSRTSSHAQLASPSNSLHDKPSTPGKNDSASDLSLNSTKDNPKEVNLDSPAKPRLVGLSQPYFTTSLPLEPPKKQLEAMERVAVEASKSGGKVRVLVAEDNKVNQEVVLRMLKLEDIYDVTVAKDGLEALDMVRQSMEEEKRFDLIFMDVQMPNLDGLQSTRAIRKMGFSAPIVALTAFAEESNVKECYDSGMDFFLPKPIRRPQLKQVLKKYCATIPEADEGESTSPTVAAAGGRVRPSAYLTHVESTPDDDDVISPIP